jgi:hypothetical protein
MGGGAIGSNPAMGKVMEILMSQRQPVQPYGPMGIFGGGGINYSSQTGEGGAEPNLPPGGDGSGDNNAVPGVDYYEGSDGGGFVNPSDVGGGLFG